MDRNYIKKWCKYAGVRALKTFAQSLATLIGGDAVGFIDIDWLHILSLAGVTALLSILTSVGGLPEVKLPDQED